MAKVSHCKFVRVAAQTRDPLTALTPHIGSISAGYRVLNFANHRRKPRDESSFFFYIGLGQSHLDVHP